MNYRRIFVAHVAVPLLFISLANAQQRSGDSPGLQPYVPTRIDWLTTTLQASLRSEALEGDKFILQITSPDSETILIYVRYMPTVDRESMNIIINATRDVINKTAKGYGWDKWLKIREDVQPAK